MEQILQNYCNIQKINNYEIIFIHYKYLRQILNSCGDTVPSQIYAVVLQKLIDTIDDVLIGNPEFTLNVFMKDIVLKDVHRHSSFIRQMAEIMRTRYQDKLKICYIHQAPFVFQQVFAIINPFLDSKTKKKIIVTDNKSLDENDLESIRNTLEMYAVPEISVPATSEYDY